MIIIIGAGLSGLVTAYQLKKQRIQFKILEARNRIGGRINTVSASDETPVEMGATWFNEQHKNLISLLQELNLGYFEQYMNDAVFYQRSQNSPLETIQIPNQSYSFRISGGTSHLIKTLFEKLDSDDIVFNQNVKAIAFENNTFTIIANQTFKADQVVLSLSPKLWSKNIKFKPKLPDNLTKFATETQTWMEDSIKIALTYQTPFWEQDNIPSSLYSNVGLITEFYDHCDHKRDKFALCGFVNSDLKNLSEIERRKLIINQITSVFGPKAAQYNDYFECIWSNEEHTFKSSDSLLFPHQNNGNPIFRTSYFDNKLHISSSEASAEFAGYMDGAVCSGNHVANKITKKTIN